jgi:hypothetical protein
MLTVAGSSINTIHRHAAIGYKRRKGEKRREKRDFFSLLRSPFLSLVI